MPERRIRTPNRQSRKAGAPPGKKAVAARTDADILAKAAAPAGKPEAKPATSGVAAPAQAPMRVRVVTGDLAFARHPVIVGHFLGDSIAGAEASLDLALNSSLKKRYALGVYPGAVGTAMVVPAPGGACPRGVVIGLGDIGEFSPGMIRAALISGLLELGLSPHRPDGEDGVSLILLGTRAGTVSSSDTLTATLAALTEAQRRLAEQGLRPFPDVDFIALYKDDSHKIWHTLRRFEQSPHYRDSFILEREVVYSAGAQRRLMRLEDPDFWRAIQITAADAAKGEVGYRFVAVGERARAEGYLVGADETFVSKFIRAAQNRQLEAAPTRALFQLIWPPELKQSSQDDRNLRLILDVAAAALPFELMDDRPTPAEGEAVHSRPPAVRRGMLRQLIQSRFARLQTSPRGGRRALVVGDPRGGVVAPDFEPLAGAREEAEMVAALLENEGYEVVRLIGNSVTPDQVVEHILQGGWTILHVSAHGIYNYAFRTDRDEAKAKGWDGKGSSYTGPRHTGIVLGDRLTLSPSILQSMPDPPVLAFLNCCDLASVNPGDEARLRASARPEFAASFAGELIALGTRAVIAAGWEVSDAGALIFARSAYRELLANNQGFGDAVRIARGDVYDAEPDDATWGAYQCYGEPDWRLHPDSEIKVRSWPSPVFASPTEAIAAIEGIRSRAKLGGARRHFGMLKRLAVIDSMLGKLGWLERDGVREHLGHAYLALGEPGRALEHFEEALKQDAGPTLRLVEALADIRIHEAGGRPRPAAEAIRQWLEQWRGQWRRPRRQRNPARRRARRDRIGARATGLSVRDCRQDRGAAEPDRRSVASRGPAPGRGGARRGARPDGRFLSPGLGAEPRPLVPFGLLSRADDRDGRPAQRPSLGRRSRFMPGRARRCRPRRGRGGRARPARRSGDDAQPAPGARRGEEGCRDGARSRRPLSAELRERPQRRPARLDPRPASPDRLGARREGQEPGRGPVGRIDRGRARRHDRAAALREAACYRPAGD